MTTFKNRADLLIAAGESIKMQEKAGIEPVVKFDGGIRSAEVSNFGSSKFGIQEYEFPLAVVEGKPVFVGDELYSMRSGKKIVIGNSLSGSCFGADWVAVVSWLPPKSRTVMVELLREDAEYLSRTAQERLTTVYAIDRAGMACRKALEQK